MSDPLLPREVRRRLAIIQHAEEVTGNVAMTSRYYGISRTVYYRWLRRYREQGVDGLRDLSRRPRHSPNATHVDVVGTLSPPELPFRAGQDRDVPQAIPRRRGIPLRGMRDPQAPGPQPGQTGLPARTAGHDIDDLAIPAGHVGVDELGCGPCTPRRLAPIGQ